MHKLIPASIFPSLTLWYPRHKLQYRIGLFFGAASVSGAFSGILAYGISFMSGTAGKLGWSWIFVRSSYNIDNGPELIGSRSSRDVQRLPSAFSPSSVCAPSIFVGPLPVLQPLRSVMVDFPSTAKFLTPEEKKYVIWRKSEWA